MKKNTLFVYCNHALTHYNESCTERGDGLPAKVLCYMRLLTIKQIKEYSI